MPIDHWRLLEWMVEREESESSRPTMFGTEFIQWAAQLTGAEASSWDEVARTAAHLKRIGYIAWRYMPTPNVDRPEPPLEFVDSAFLQRVQEIHVTGAGHRALADRRADLGPRISISNSTVGQLALRDIQNIDIFVVLDAMERSLSTIDATDEEKEQARSAIQRMREAGSLAATTAVGSVLGAALRQALGLP